MMWHQPNDWDSQRREVERMEDRVPFQLSVDNSFREYERMEIETKTEDDHAE